MSDVYANSPLATPVLNAVAQAVLPKMWLTKVSFSASFPLRHQGEGKLTLEGYISAGKEGTEDLLVGGQFKESIAKQPALKRLCRNANIRYVNISASTLRKTRASKEGTQFVLTCENEPKSRGR